MSVFSILACEGIRGFNRDTITQFLQYDDCARCRRVCKEFLRLFENLWLHELPWHLLHAGILKGVYRVNVLSIVDPSHPHVSPNSWNLSLAMICLFKYEHVNFQLNDRHLVAALFRLLKTDRLKSCHLALFDTPHFYPFLTRISHIESLSTRQITPDFSRFPVFYNLTTLSIEEAYGHALSLDFENFPNVTDLCLGDENTEMIITNGHLSKVSSFHGNFLSDDPGFVNHIMPKIEDLNYICI